MVGICFTCERCDMSSIKIHQGGGRNRSDLTCAATTKASPRISSETPPSSSVVVELSVEFRVELFPPDSFPSSALKGRFEI